MNITQFLSLLGGLALFLLGMNMMSDGLEKAAGNKMKKILEKLTTNRFLGVAVGAAITAVIQSSSATTVMVVGFVNSGLMTLRQAIWVIMGANIGTTITGQLIALDVGVIAPVFAIVGVVFIVFLKSKKLYHIGHIIGGLGVLFVGMEMMSGSMSGLRDSQLFMDTVTNLSNPLLGIAVGAIFTAIIQSSSASVGILQALSMSGAITLNNSVFVLFGQNIGTCITAVLASIGTTRNAKRTTIIHLMFNIIGTVIFTCICLVLPFTDWIIKLTPNNSAAQIANVHTIFNIVTTFLLLPVGTYLEKIAKKILPEREDENNGEMKLQFISPTAVINHSFGGASVAISQIHKEVNRMYDLAVYNVQLSFDQVLHWEEKKVAIVEQNEEYIDFLNAEISKYISSIISAEMSEKDGKAIGMYLGIIGNVERISDHAVNISGYADLLKEKGSMLAETVEMEVRDMKRVALGNLKNINMLEDNITVTDLDNVIETEDKIDEMAVIYRENQLCRLLKNECKGDISVIYSELITDFERIGDHIMNIAEYMAD
ncbi:phosphate:Na+ symporter [Anaerosporobacter mobilis DSM 15930]|jgi:phosphate:Na+ symporter|uniref:Phosphate:Na+ symporter n=1 Tax=Anaerosporobacter mobilis DSM 15930 TaxID=1120996 RepID=A0A1M7HVR5_9FIRM|nr:Na/Pi cotransporter family protein [Anaerosporobacter mobilis]SHM32508.1 phosphate:Na+ symporter [Anaerosporobacter mobilis DSM 15930]